MRGLELGLILPNYGHPVSVEGVARTADAAERLGFDAVWATEHVIVGPQEDADPYTEVLHPFNCLAWLAARVQRVRLGTSIAILPLHDPFLVAKQAATLQALSGGRFRLGVGVGWHEPEYRFMGQGFEDRGARADEELRLIRALWTGQTEFAGEFWSFEAARFGPLPDPLPEVFVGGNSSHARRRAHRYGSVWHPVSPSFEDVAESKRDAPEVRVVPRMRVRLGTHGGSGLSGSPGEIADQIRGWAGRGVDGFVLEFVGDGDPIEAIETFASEVVPRLDD